MKSIITGLSIAGLLALTAAAGGDPQAVEDRLAPHRATRHLGKKVILSTANFVNAVCHLVE